MSSTNGHDVVSPAEATKGLRIAAELGSDEDQLLTVKQVQSLLQVGRDVAYRLVNSGELPSIRFGGSRGVIRVPRRALRAFIAEELEHACDPELIDSAP
jgi:excisionase family DNA binding protein